MAKVGYYNFVWSCCCDCAQFMVIVGHGGIFFNPVRNWKMLWACVKKKSTTTLSFVFLLCFMSLFVCLLLQSLRSAEFDFIILFYFRPHTPDMCCRFAVLSRHTHTLLTTAKCDRKRLGHLSLQKHCDFHQTQSKTWVNKYYLYSAPHVVASCLTSSFVPFHHVYRRLLVVKEIH